MNTQYNEIFGEVLHMASQAMVADDVNVKRAAIGDIVDALASVIPSERAGGHAGRVTLPRTKIRAINLHLNVVAKANVMGRKFYAEAEYNEEYYVAHVYEDRGEDGINDVCRIDFEDHCGGNAVMKILRGILIGISSHYGHMRRKRANKRAREAAQNKEEA